MCMPLQTQPSGKWFEVAFLFLTLCNWNLSSPNHICELPLTCRFWLLCFLFCFLFLFFFFSPDEVNQSIIIRSVKYDFCSLTSIPFDIVLMDESVICLQHFVSWVNFILNNYSMKYSTYKLAVGSKHTNQKHNINALVNFLNW